MSDIITVPMAQQRDIKTVTAEIRTLTQQGQRLALEYAIEIGRRLKEAKSMLPHGQWGRWLKEEVEFSQSSAVNFMRLFEEYGADQITIFGAEAKSEALGKLTYTKALKLLAMPEEEREAFVRENPVEEMSSRELEQAIRERDQARQRLEEAETRLEELEQAGEREQELEKQLAEAKKEADTASFAAKKAGEELKRRLAQAEAEKIRAEEEREKARKELERLKSNPEIPAETLGELAREAKKEARQELKDKTKKLEDKVRAAEEKAAEAEKKAEELRKRIATASPETAQFKLVFEQVQEDFNRLMGLLIKIRGGDGDSGGKLTKAVYALLASMEKRLEAGT